MSNSEKESFALRQQKYTNAIIRGRRHVPTPEAIPPSSLLDAPQLPPVPLPSPPREPLPEPRYRRPKHLVNNLNKKQPAPKGGFTAVNRYAKTPTNPDENAKVFAEYAERLTNIQQKQNNMGEGKPRKRRTSRRAKTPAHVSMMNSQEHEENMPEAERYMAKMESMKTVQDSMGMDRTKSKKSRKPAKAPTSRKTVENSIERIPTSAEYDSWMERTVGEFYAPTPMMDRDKDLKNASRTAEVEQTMETDTKQKAIKKQKKKKRKTCMETSPDYTANVSLDHMSATFLEVYTPDWEEEGRGQSCYSMLSQPGYLSREDNTPTMDREEDPKNVSRLAEVEQTIETDTKPEAIKKLEKKKKKMMKTHNEAPARYTANVGLDNISATSLEVYTPDWEEEDKAQSCNNMLSQPGHLSREDSTPTMDREKDCLVYTPDWEEEDQAQSCYNMSSQPGHLSRVDNTPTMDWEKDCKVCDLDWEKEDQAQTCNTSPQPEHLSREDDTPIKDSTKGWMYIIRKNALEEMMATGHGRDEDSLHRRTPVQGKTTKKSHRPRKEKIVLPSLTADPGLILQGTKLHSPGVSLPSIGDGALSTAALPNIPDEEIGTKLPQLQFGTKRVGKTTSDTVTFKQPSDKSNVRSTKRHQKTDSASLKDKKSQKRRHHSSDHSSPDL